MRQKFQVDVLMPAYTFSSSASCQNIIEGSSSLLRLPPKRGPCFHHFQNITMDLLKVGLRPNPRPATMVCNCILPPGRYMLIYLTCRILLELKQLRHTTDLTTSIIPWTASLYVTPVEESFPVFGRINARMALPWSSAHSSSCKSIRRCTPHLPWIFLTAC